MARWGMSLFYPGKTGPKVIFLIRVTSNSFLLGIRHSLLFAIAFGGGGGLDEANVTYG